MWILPSSWFLLEAGTKSRSLSTPVYPFFLTSQLSAPALISEEEMEFPKISAEQVLRIVAMSHETAVNSFLEGLL